MTLTTRLFAGFVLAASAVVLGIALLSQYWGGLLPCELCLKERWPWAIAITISIVALLAGGAAARRLVAALLAVVFAAGTALAAYHVGVEQHWIAGPSTCTASGGHAKTLAEMKALILNAAPVPCDQVRWSLWGVSMAGWNFVASLAMFALCIVAAWPAPRRETGRRGGTA